MASSTAAFPECEGSEVENSFPCVTLSPPTLAATQSESKGPVQEQDVVEGAKGPVLYSTLAETLDWETIAYMEGEVVYFDYAIVRKLRRLEVHSCAPLPSRASCDWEETLEDDKAAMWSPNRKSPGTELEEACMALGAQEAELIEKYTPKGVKHRKSY